MISIATCSGVEYIECKLVVGNCNGTWTVWWCNFSAFNTKPPLYRLHHSLCCIMKNTDFEHRIEINQKSDSRENLSPFLQCACPEIHHRYAILTPSWQVPPPALNFWLSRLRKLTFCTKIRKSWWWKLPGGTCQDGILMAMMRCVRWHAWGQLQRCWHLVGTSGYQAPTVLPCYMWVKNILKLVTFKLFFCSQF